LGVLVENKLWRNKLFVFRDRFDAGITLASFLLKHNVDYDLVIAIPAGGVPVGIEIARLKRCKLYLAITRKILYPWTTEAGFGAVSWMGEVEVNRGITEVTMISDADIDRSIKRAFRSIEKRMELFKEYLPPKDLGNQKVVIVDDGLATGYTMLVTVRSIKKLNPGKIIVAVPTSSESAINMIIDEVDYIYVINLRTGLFYAVADAYKYWRDLSEEEVLEMVRKYYEWLKSGSPRYVRQ